MPSERARWGKLTQTVPDHVLSNVDGHVPAAIVYGDRVSHHLRKDNRSPRPGLDDALFAALIHRLDLFQQTGLNVRPFFK